MTILKYLRFSLLALPLLQGRYLHAQVPHRAPVEVPLLTLTDTDPWLSVIGSDSPSLVILPSGWILRTDSSEHLRAPYTADSIGPAAVDALLRRLGVVPSLLDPDSAIIHTPDCSPGSPWREVSHPAYRVLFLRQGSRSRAIGIRGSIPPVGCSTGSHDGLYALLRALGELTPSQSIPMTPPSVEVMVAPSYGPAATSDWPQWLPTPNTTAARGRGSRDFSLYVDGSVLTELAALADSTPSRPIVMALNDSLWYIQGLRFVFPGDEDWLPLVHLSH